MNSGSESIRAFGVFELDTYTGELRKRGVRLSVPGQALSVLSMLLERPGDLVTRDDLRRRLWPDDTFVDFNHSVNTAVNRLREALGDSAQSPRFVETLPRRGYRFIGQVSNTQLQNAGAASQSPRVLLAVLPLQDLSDDPTQEYFSEGLTEELITQLGGFDPHGLGVIARTSVTQYKGTTRSIREIGRELQVDFVLEGSVRRANGRVRISAQLIRVSDQTHVWAQSYERDLGDILKLQDEVAGAVANEIRIRIAPKGGRGATRSQPIDPEAYELYLKGRHYFGKISHGGLRKGLECFSAAIARDESFAPSYAGLADCYWKLGQLGLLRPIEAFPHAKRATQRALELDPMLADAQASVAAIAMLYDWDWTGAESGFQRAIQLNPNLAAAHAWYAFFLLAMGRGDEAFDKAGKATALEPLGRITNGIFGTCLLFAGQAESAAEQFRKTIELHPDFFPAYFMMATALLRCSRFEESVEFAEKGTELSGVSRPSLYAGLAYASSGRREKAGILLEQMILESQKTYVPATAVALLSLKLGHWAQALKWFDQAFDERDGGLIFLRSLPVFGVTRFIPRLGKIVRRMNFP